MKPVNKSFLLVAQIFAILGAVGFGFGALLVYFISATLYIETGMGVTFVYVVLAVLDIVAVVQISQVKNGVASPGVALGWSIFLIFGAGFIGGVFGILGALGVGADTTINSAPSSTLEQKLEELDRLYNKGLLTRDEYLARRKKIIFED